MNHSILVVICDFLVLSVLSLSLGVAPVNSNYMGRGTQIDDYTANLLLDELKAECVQLRNARKTLLASQRKLGYAEARSTRVKKLDNTLAKVQSRLNYLEAKLKRRKGEIGKLSKEKLLARLEKESIRRLKIVNEMSTTKAALEFEQAKNRKLATNAVILRQNVILRDDQLANKKNILNKRAAQLKTVSKRLKKTASELSSTKGQLQKTATALDSAHGSLQKSTSDLSSTKVALWKKSNELVVSKHALNITKLRLLDIAIKLKGSQGETKSTQMDLSYTRGQLSAKEKELAENRGRLTKIQKTAAVNQLELKEAQQKITNLKVILTKAVGDMSKTQNELDKYKSKMRNTTETLAETKIKLIKSSSNVKSAQMALKDTKESLKDTKESLKDTKESLKEVVHRLQSESLEKYSQTAVLLKVNILEKRFFWNNKKSGTFYLPEVLIAGKRYLISPLELFNILGRQLTKSSRLSELSYMVGKPKNGDSLFRVKKPLLSLNIDNRVCMLEVPAVRKASLKLLTYGKLRKRGLQNLTLFKNKTFGRDSSSLNGRCSLGLKKGDNYLYIRNSVRKNAPQLKVEVGDFIITKQGEFVGIAVEVENFKLARKQRVKCFVFPDNFKVENIVELPLVKRSGENYFRAFAKAVTKINSRIKHLNRINRTKKSD